jgi:phosphatidylinositol alpha-1,6-mannosyltransferase
MKILLIAGSYPPEVGGIADLMQAFVHGLLGKGVDVKVVANPKLPRGYLKQVQACRDLVRERTRHTKFDRIVVSSWSPYGVGMPGKFDTFCYGMDLLEPSRSIRYRLLMKRTLRRASRILAISRYTAELAERAGAEARQIVMVPPGVDGQKFRPVKRSSHSRVILSIGRLVERKGFDMILRALPAVAKSFPDVEYWCAGDGPDRNRLQQVAEEMKIAKRVQWLGEISDEEKLKRYQTADVFVMPNRISEKERSVEGFGIVFLEAGACGLPVIGGNSGGVPDAVVNGITGYLVDPMSAPEISQRLIELLSNPGLRQMMGHAARQRVLNEFRPDQIAERYLNGQS